VTYFQLAERRLVDEFETELRFFEYFIVKIFFYDFNFIVIFLDSYTASNFFTKYISQNFDQGITDDVRSMLLQMVISHLSQIVQL